MSQSDLSQESLEFSQPLEISWSEAKEFQVPFGKYKGKTLASMIKNGKRRNYLRYLQKWDDLRENTKANIVCAIKHYEQMKQTHLKKIKEKLKQ